jgi:glycine C-acetyltransferase|tara:strand:+ start:1232 stop:2434 length:1203 start_codon:yes stop_codon:yes gene_type:complete
MNPLMKNVLIDRLSYSLNEMQREGLFKNEIEIRSPQAARVDVGHQNKVLNLCANNYLGLADNDRLISAAKNALDTYGFGMASVRFICGTQDKHKELEEKLAEFLGKDDAILFASCFDANCGLFEALLGPQDAVVSDNLNHASIIDGIRLSKAQRYRYHNNDPVDLEIKLKQARTAGSENIIIATDGVFSMDGTYANLPEISRLAKIYDALVMVDDCHATGFVGTKGKGTSEYFGVNVDILTGTLGKALGGAIGGYIAGPQRVIDMLRQRARPYLFSNSLPPVAIAAGLEAINIINESDYLRKKLHKNSIYWRKGLKALGFDLIEGEHPIIPVMLGDALLSQKMAERLFALGVYVAGFFFPVVPKGQSRIRTQMNAAFTTEDLDQALHAFEKVGRELGVIT